MAEFQNASDSEAKGGSENQANNLTYERLLNSALDKSLTKLTPANDELNKTNVGAVLFSGALTGAAIDTYALRSSQQALSTSWNSLVNGSIESNFYATGKLPEIQWPQSSIKSSLINNTLQPIHASRMNALVAYDQAKATQGLIIASNTELAAAKERLAGAIFKNKTCEVLSLPGMKSALTDSCLRQYGADSLRLGTVPGATQGAIGTIEEVAAGSKLFVTGSEGAKTLLAAERLSTELFEHQSGLRLTQQAMKTSFDRFYQQESRLLSIPLESAAIRGAGKGMMACAFTLGAGYALDNALGNQFGYKSQLDATPRILLDAVAIPAILVSSLPARDKAAVAGSIFLAARAADAIDSLSGHPHTDTKQTSSLMRLNTLDGIGVSAAALAPIPTKYKVLAMGATLVAGRAYNMAENYLKTGSLLPR